MRSPRWLERRSAPRRTPPRSRPRPLSSVRGGGRCRRGLAAAARREAHRGLVTAIPGKKIKEMTVHQEELAVTRDKKVKLVGNYVHDSVPVSNDEVRARQLPPAPARQLTPARPPARPSSLPHFRTRTTPSCPRGAPP